MSDPDRGHTCRTGHQLNCPACVDLERHAIAAAHGLGGIVGDLQRQRDALTARIHELEEALREYGEHMLLCDYRIDSLNIKARTEGKPCRPCSCGYAAALKEGETP